MKYQITSIIVAITVAVLSLAGCALCTEPLPVRVDVKAKTVYSPGLPIVVEVTVTNISDGPVETLIPSRKLHTIGASLRREGETDYLHPNMHSTYMVSGAQTVVLKPGQKAVGKLDLSMKFQDALPPGRYLCTAGYSYGKNYEDGRYAQSKPALIVIEEPTLPDPGNQEWVRRLMRKFIAARLYLFDDHNYDMARRIFTDISNADRHSDYGFVSAYYQATLEKEPKARLAAYLKCLQDPASDLPDLVEPDDILQSVARLYFEAGDLKAARETLLKIIKRDATAEQLLHKIEAALKVP